jgi:ferrous iron transport protein A
MRTVLIHTRVMDVAAAPVGIALAHGSSGLNPGYVSLSALTPGSSGLVVGVGTRNASMSALERRLLELGFISGEQFEILAEAWPGRDPFVVRVGNTTLALRRREAESIWVEISRTDAAIDTAQAAQ